MQRETAVHHQQASSVLVIGGDSTLGGLLVDRLSRKKSLVVSTTRHRITMRPNQVFLDLSTASLDASNLPEAIGWVVICAAMTNQQACAENPEESRRVNVTNTIELCKWAAQQNAKTILLSTNLIFDGLEPSAGPNSPIAPQSLYAQQKAEVEEVVLRQPGNTVCRLSKVLDQKTPLISKWIAKLRSGAPVKAFSDYKFAPVHSSIVIEVLTKIIEQKRPGIYQVSATETISYAEFARMIARALGLSPELVEGSLAPPHVFPESGMHRPIFMDMDTKAIQKKLGISPPTIEATIDLLLAQA